MKPGFAPKGKAWIKSARFEVLVVMKIQVEVFWNDGIIL
jgi:hypothetical protein